MGNQIIIDGVDVAECLFYQTNFEEDADVYIKDYCSNWYNSCNGKENCYYKQLQRKTQECTIYYNYWIECKALLEWHEQHEQYMQEKCFDLIMENDKLKEDLTALQQTYEACEKEYKRVIEENKIYEEVK